MAMPLHDRIATGIFWIATVPVVLFFIYLVVVTSLDSGFSFWLLGAGLFGLLCLGLGIRQCYRVLRSGDAGVEPNE